MGWSETKEKKESVIVAIKKHKRKIDKTIEQSHGMNNDVISIWYFTENIEKMGKICYNAYWID